MPDQKTKLLTEVELELMNILWHLRQGTVKEVIAELPEDRKLAYTSVSTILRILEQKKIILSTKQGRGHIYSPLLKKEDYEQKTISHVLENVFDGTPLSLAKAFLKSNDLKPKDIDELKNLLNNLDI